jgi:hypothetical protein
VSTPPRGDRHRERHGEHGRFGTRIADSEKADDPRLDRAIHFVPQLINNAFRVVAHDIGVEDFYPVQAK